MLAVDFKNLRECWLSPNGEVRGCWPNHEGEAYDIIREIGKREDFNRKRDRHETEYAYEYLESIGWIRLHAATQKWVCEKRPTAKQRRVIKEWCFDNSVAFEDSMSVEYDGRVAL